MDPTTDPEEPAESKEPMDIEGGSTVNGAEVNAAGDSYTVTIENYATLRDQITIEANVGDARVKIPVNGQITATEGEANKPAIAVTLTDTANWKIQEVTKGGEKVAGSSPYSISGLTEDTTIAVTVAAVYQASVDNTAAKSATIKVKNKNSEAENPPAIPVGTTNVEIKKGDPTQSMEFTVDGYDYTATDTKLKVYYSTDGSTDPDDREELTAVMTEEGEPKTKVYTYMVPADVIASLTSSIKIVLVKETAANYKTKIDALIAGDIGTVKYQKPKTEGTGFDWAADGKSTAFVGDTLNFQIALTDAAKAVKEIKGVKLAVGGGEAEAITCTPDAVNGTANCSFVVTEEMADPTQLTFTADIAYKEANRTTLTYELGQNVDADSVTAVKVKSVTYGTGAAITDSTLDSLLGTTSGSLVGDEGPESVIIPNKQGEDSLAKVVVETTIKGGYKVDAAAGITFAAGTATYTFGGTGNIALSTALKATITTKVAAAAGARYFTAAKAASNADGIDTVVVTPVSGKVTEKGEAPNKYWEVAEGVETVEVKVTAAEDKKVICDVAGLQKAMTAAAPSNNKVVYTVTLFASVLDNTATSAAPQAITFTSDNLTFSAAAQNPEKDEVVGATVTMGTKTSDAADSATWTPYTSGKTIAYGQKFHAMVVPTAGYTLTKVSYTVTDQFDKVSDPVDVKIDELQTDKDSSASWVDAGAEITIAKVQGDITITVETAKEDASSYKLEVPGVFADSEVTPLDEETDKDIDGIWQAAYDTTYVADVTNSKTGLSVDAKDVIVKVMDGGSAVSMTYPVVTDSNSAKHRSFKLNKNLAGKEITVDVSVKEKTGEATPVGTYRMQVAPRTSFITINGGAAIEQAVDQEKTYDIATDGQGELTATVVGNNETFNDLIHPAIDDNVLTITTDAIAAKTEIATNKGTAEAPEWEYKKATIVVTDGEVEGKVDITLKELFDPDATPALGARDNGDTVLNLTLGMAAEEPEVGTLEYVVTVTPEAATADNPFPTEKLLASVTVPNKAWEADTIKLPVTVAKSGNLGEGAGWNYKVTAKLVYTNGVKTFVSKVAELDTATQPLKFENNLKLKKAKGAPSALYTGQNEPVVIAEPQWTTKYSSYKIENSVSDSSYGLSLSVNAEGKIVVDSVADDANVGKHTITVIAKADETGNGNDMGESHTMYASRATITVNVVKGINKLRVDVPSTKISKIDSRKAVTLKTNLVYNDSDQDYDYDDVWSWDGKKYITAPKSKKVKWSIVGADSYESDGVYYIKPAHASLNANTKNGVSVKNGTITIPKTYMPDSVHPSYNKFMVLVEADDFKGNDTKILSAPIEITADAIDLSNLAVVKRIAKAGNGEREYYGDTFKVIAVGGRQATAVSADELQGAIVYALENPVSKDTVYSYAQWQKVKAKKYNSVSFKSGSTKVLTIDPNMGNITSVTPGKKATITVNAEDGSKKKATLSLQIGYRNNEGKDLALQIGTMWDDENEITGKDIYEPKKVETAVAKDFTATGAAVLGVQVMQGKKSDGTSTNLNEKMDTYTNYKLQVKGGKIVYQNPNTGYARVVSTSKVTTLTLTDLNVAKGAPKKVYTYTLTNKAYDGLAKAPKVTVKGNLHEDGNDKEQTIKLNIADAAKGAKVMVEMDYSAEPKWNEKKPGPNYTFWYIEDYLYRNNNNDNVFTVDENGDVAVNLDSDHYYGDDYTPGSYKLKVTTGTGNNNKQFTPNALPATVSVKVVKDKAFTFTPTTTYTINKLDGGAVLTGKSNANAKLGEGVILNFNKLQNANLNGVSNKFTHYFTIENDPTSKTQRLVLNRKSEEVQKMLYNEKDGKIDLNSPKEDPVITIPKEDLTGYVRYTAIPTVNYFTNGSVGGTVKITVKVAPEAKAGKAPKASQKYVPQNTEISTKKDGTTQVNILVNGSYVDVAYALIDDSKRGNTEGLVLDTANKSGTKDGQIVLKATQALTEGQKCTVNLLIIPESSMYKALIDKASDTPASSAKANADAAEGETTTPAAKTKADLIKFYGIPVKVTLVAKEKFTPTPSNKPVTNQVASVSVTPTTASVAKGGTLQFSATARNASGSVISSAGATTWAVAGNAKQTTTISATGLLTVAADETAATLTVTATIDGKSGRATVTVTDATDPGDEKTAAAAKTLLEEKRDWTSKAVLANKTTLAANSGLVAALQTEIENALTTAGYTGADAATVALGGTSDDGELTIVTGATPTATVKFDVTVGGETEADVTVTIATKWEITNVVVSADPATVTQGTGGTVNCTATVTGDTGSEVTWSIDDGHDGGTSISNTGVLTVSNAETVGTITVTATSKNDPTQSGTATVTVQ